MGKTKNRGSPRGSLRAFFSKIGAALGGNSDKLREALADNNGLRMYVDWLVVQEAIREAIAEAHCRDAEALRRVIDEVAVPALRKLELEGHPSSEVREKLEQACMDVVDEDIVEATVRAEEACSDQQASCR
jgi:hypothetical protein